MDFVKTVFALLSWVLTSTCAHPWHKGLQSIIFFKRLDAESTHSRLRQVGEGYWILWKPGFEPATLQSRVERINNSAKPLPQSFLVKYTIICFILFLAKYNIICSLIFLAKYTIICSQFLVQSSPKCISCPFSKVPISKTLNMKLLTRLSLFLIGRT